MPFITFLCLIIFVCILMGDDGFKIMGVVLAFGVVAGVILGIIGITNTRMKTNYRTRMKNRKGISKNLGSDD